MASTWSVRLQTGLVISLFLGSLATVLLRFDPAAVGRDPGEVPSDERALLSAISEGGRYNPRMAFLFNRAIVVWEPARREFLQRTGLVLQDRYPGQPRGGPNPFGILIDYAASHDWPEVDALIARAELWRALRL